MRKNIKYVFPLIYIPAGLLICFILNGYYLEFLLLGFVVFLIIKIFELI